MTDNVNLRLKRMSLERTEMRRIAVVLMLVFVAAVAEAQSVSIVSKYMDPAGWILHDGPALQGSYTLEKKGAYIDFWGSRSLDGNHSEIDYTLGWANEYVDLSVAYFDLEPLWQPNDVVQGTTEFGLPKTVGDHEVRGYMIVDYLWSRENSDQNSGELVRFGVSDAWAISPRFSLNQNAWLLRDGGIFKGEMGYLLRYEAGVGLKRAGYTLEPAIRISVPFVSDRETEVALLLKVSP